MRLCGTFKERVSTGVHDSLRVRSFVFTQGRTRFVISGCDLAMVRPELGRVVRKRLEAKGFIGSNILIHASETHNAPDYFGEFRDVFHERAVARHGEDPLEPIEYESFLAEKMIESILEAEKRQRTASVSFGSTAVPNTAFNRRFLMKDGSIGWNPGKKNPNIREPAGPVDERLTVLSFQEPGESFPFAILPGFPLHLAILNDRDYSADYPFYLSSELKKQLGETLMVHFLQAPCCEINHIDVSTDEVQKGHPWAAEVGSRLANSTLQVLSSGEGEVGARLSTASKTVDLNLQRFSKSEVAAAEAAWESPDRDSLPFLELVRAGKIYGIANRHQGGPIPVLLQAFQFSHDTALIGLPSEVSVEIGLHIQKESVYGNTMIVQLSNDWFGYVPTRRIFEQGHYEAEVAKIEVGEGERLAAAALELLSELKKSAIPDR